MHKDPADHDRRIRAGQTDEYTCPMHPEVVRSEPGNCPMCGMTLVSRGTPMEHATAHGDMMVDDHRKLLWPHHLILDLWLVSSPFTLGYLSDFVPDENQLRVMAERGLPPFELRNLAMAWSDVISGILVIALSVLVPMMPEIRNWKWKSVA